MRWLILALLLLVGCGNTSEQHHPWQEITGRDTGETPFHRHNIYRARTPSSWIRIDPAPNTSNHDTRESLVEFRVDEDIRITVHNFPSEQIDKRIPVPAQIARWKRQMTDLDPTLPVVERPVSHGGFAGTFLHCRGQMDQKPTELLGWAMQLDAEHYRNLTTMVRSGTSRSSIEQQRSDYTIKVTGPKELISKHSDTIHSFARSFELIEPVPTRL